VSFKEKRKEGHTFKLRDYLLWCLQLALCLDHRQEKKLLSTPQHTSSDQDLGHRTETSFNDSPTPNEHDSFENYVSKLALGLPCHEPQSVGGPTRSYSPGCSSESEKGEFSRSNNTTVIISVVLAMEFCHILFDSHFAL